jgi:FMN reductase
MPSVIAISASPSATSKTGGLADYVLGELSLSGIVGQHLRLRELPPSALMFAQTSDGAVEEAIAAVQGADGIILATPTYKAAYSGLLKVFLDLLPQFAFTGKAVLPLATGGTLAHVLALDYALRPVVHSMGARHVVQSYFLLEKHLSLVSEKLVVHDDSRGPLSAAILDFRNALEKASPVASG